MRATAPRWIVEYAKLTVLISVIITVISVFIALLMAFISFGTSSAAIPPIIAGGRTAVWLAIKQLIQKMMQKIAQEGLKNVLKQAIKKLGKELAQEIAEEIVEEVILIDGLAQLYQMATGTRDTWDTNKTLTAGVGAALGAPIGMVVGPAVRSGRQAASRALNNGLSDSAVNAANRNIAQRNNPATRMGGLNRWAGAWPASAIDAGLTNAVVSPTASSLANGLVNGQWNWDFFDAGAGLAGAGRGNTLGLGGSAAAIGNITGITNLGSGTTSTAVIRDLTVLGSMVLVKTGPVRTGPGSSRGMGRPATVRRLATVRRRGMGLRGVTVLPGVTARPGTVLRPVTGPRRVMVLRLAAIRAVTRRRASQ